MRWKGSIFIAGAVVQWLRDGLGLIKSSSEIEALAQTVPDNGGVYLVPAFTGLGAPHWDPFARGTITGLTRGTTAGHLARAALESIAYQTADVLAAMEADSGLAHCRIAGGWRRDGERRLDAVSGGYSGRPAGAAQNLGNDGAGGRVSGGVGDGLLEGHR
jgi:glycerol kinase